MSWQDYFFLLAFIAVHYITSSYKNNLIENNAAILGLLLSEHPELEEEIIPLLTKGVSEEMLDDGLELLESYGSIRSFLLCSFPVGASWSKC